jgi:hypothetical protein
LRPISTDETIHRKYLSHPNTKLSPASLAGSIHDATLNGINTTIKGNNAGLNDRSSFFRADTDTIKGLESGDGAAPQPFEP